MKDGGATQQAGSERDLGTEPTSLGAVAVAPRARVAAPAQPIEEPPPVDETPATSGRLRRAACKLFVGGALAGCVWILALAVTRAHPSWKASAHRTITDVQAAPAPAPAEVAQPAPAAPKEAVATPASTEAPPERAPKPTPTPPVKPAATTSTIALAPSVPKGKQLVVDGKKVKSGSVIVPCGAHTVAVDKEKPHRIEAECGEKVLVETAKSAPTRAKSSSPKSTKTH